MHDVLDMRVFVAVVEAGGFSAAARQLGLSVAVISSRVARLERQFSVKLLTRTTRKVRLTDVGSLCYDSCCQILSNLDELGTLMAGYSSDPQGVLRITAPTPLGRRWIAPLVTRFQQQFPQLTIHLSLEERFANLIGEGFDIGIRNGPLKDSELLVRKLVDNQRIVCASPEYLSKYGVPETPQALKSHQCLVFNAHNQITTNWQFQIAGQPVNLKIAGTLSSNQADLPHLWALAGLGIAQKSYWEVADDLKLGKLRLVLEDYQPLPTAFYAVYPRSLSAIPKVSLFLEQLVMHLEALPRLNRHSP
ncbi:MAG: LysR family transcriptional regulator [Cyanobacteria bacterium J06626_14]